MANVRFNFLYSARSHFLAGGRVFHHPPHLTQSLGKERDSRGTRVRGANEAKRSGSGGWRDS